MAYLLHHFWPGGTEAQYNAVKSAAHPDGGGLPAGQIYHAAGVSDGGVLITAVWESKETADRFVDGLAAAGHVDGGFDGPPQELGAEIVNIETA